MVIKYSIPAFEVESIEGLRKAVDGEMHYMRLTNGWDLWIPSSVQIERLPEPLPPLVEGLYIMKGHAGAMRRMLDSEGEAIWLEWDGAYWQGCGKISHITENNKEIRDSLVYLGGFNG